MRALVSPGGTWSRAATYSKLSRLSCSRRSRCQIVRLPRSKTFTSPSSRPPARQSLYENLYPVLVVGDVNDLAREVDAPEELVEIDAEFPKMPAHETAGCEVQLSDPRDRERDRDIDFLCPVLRDPDSQNAATRAGRARRVGWTRRT